MRAPHTLRSRDQRIYPLANSELPPALKSLHSRIGDKDEAPANSDAHLLVNEKGDVSSNNNDDNDNVSSLSVRSQSVLYLPFMCHRLLICLGHYCVVPTFAHQTRISDRKQTSISKKTKITFSHNHQPVFLLFLSY